MRGAGGGQGPGELGPAGEARCASRGTRRAGHPRRAGAPRAWRQGGGPMLPPGVPPAHCRGRFPEFPAAPTFRGNRSRGRGRHVTDHKCEHSVRAGAARGASLPSSAPGSRPASRPARPPSPRRFPALRSGVPIGTAPARRPRPGPCPEHRRRAQRPAQRAPGRALTPRCAQGLGAPSPPAPGAAAARTDPSAAGHTCSPTLPAASSRTIKGRRCGPSSARLFALTPSVPRAPPRSVSTCSEPRGHRVRRRVGGRGQEGVGLPLQSDIITPPPRLAHLRSPSARGPSPHPVCSFKVTCGRECVALSPVPPHRWRSVTVCGLVNLVA